MRFFLALFNAANRLVLTLRRWILSPVYWLVFPLPHPKKVVPIGKIKSESQLNVIKQVGVAGETIRRPPQILGSLSVEHFVMQQTSPAVYSFQLPNGRVFHDGQVMTSDGRLIAEVSNISPDVLPKPLSGKAGLPRMRHFPGRLAVLAAPGSSRYFHWLLDTLPRINLLQELQPDKIYLRGKQPFVRESLEKFGFDTKDFLRSRKYAHWSADTLVGVTPLANPGCVTLEVVNLLRSLVEKKMGSRRRIYISRNDAGYRRVLNEASLLNYLDRYGFERILLSQLSFSDQLELFATADVVLAPHGAGIANVVFSPPGCTVIELMPEDYVNTCFWCLSEMCGHNYFCIGGVQTVGKRNHMHVDLKILDSALKQSLCAERFD